MEIVKYSDKIQDLLKDNKDVHKREIKQKYSHKIKVFQ